MMSAGQKSKKIQRRKPQRHGSKATVEAIYGACARILESQGLAGFNTNAIAEIAGISVGTLYGYFANKDEILQALARQEMERLRIRVMGALLDEGAAERDPARRTIRALIAGYAEGGQWRRIAMQSLIAAGGATETFNPAAQMAQFLDNQQSDEAPGAVSVIDLFILTNAIDAVVRTATYMEANFLHSKAFEDRLLALVHLYYPRGMLPAIT